MNRLWNETIRAAVIGFAIPAMLLTLAVRLSAQPVHGEQGMQPFSVETQLPATTSPSASAAQTLPTEPTELSEPTLPEVQPTEPPVPEKVNISVLMDGQVVQMDLEEYLVGVILAEMPASFELEALKAQAVVARTYALRCAGKHTQGSICTDFACCQAYIPPEKYLTDYNGTWAGLEKIREAVTATRGKVLTYDGKLVLSTYFSCSGGSTEDAASVWGQDIPYLQAVESPGEEYAAVYADSVSFTAEQFQNRLGVILPGTPQSWFGTITYTSGGGVETIEIGGACYRGTTLRTLLGLRSTVFTLKITENTITVETRGFGHRVGMSQYGADAMAAGGSSYSEILSHYYRGTQLTDYPFSA